MKSKATFAALGALILLAGCASIISKSSYPVSVLSEPEDAAIEIRNRAGVAVYKGKTPATVTLNASSGFFRGERYTILASADGANGITTLSSTIDGWYIANILFGGIIGLLVVDPLTGAMYKLDDMVTVHLSSSGRASASDERTLRVALEDVPESLHDKLVRIN